MLVQINSLNFIWWNAYNFAHFDIKRAGKPRWPASPAEFDEKLRRVEMVLTAVNQDTPLQLIALAEVTDEAAIAIRDRLFPGFKVFSVDSLIHETSDFHVAIIYNPSVGFGEEDILIPSNIPRTTRPMATVAFRAATHLIRFYACHWTARFDENSARSRIMSAAYLNEQIYDFLHPAVAQGARHVVILGDLNEEPYGNPIDNHIFSHRDRAYSKREHYSDRDIKRARLYNCAWRLLGEHNAHPIRNNEREMAGSYYREDDKTWHTFDQVIVSGSLLGNLPPYLDESSLKIVSSSNMFPDSLLDDDKLPYKFVWNNGNPKGVSDHLPIFGRLILS